MKRIARGLWIAMCLVLFFSPVVEAVTFTSSGENAAPVKKTGSPGSSPAQKGKESVLLLELPEEKSRRLAESIELLMLSGVQVDLAMGKLARFEGRSLSDEEVKAHLAYAEDAWKAFGKSGKRLEDAVALVRVAMNQGDFEKYAVPGALFQAVNQLLVFFHASPAFAQGYGYGMEGVDYQVRNIGIEAKKEFGALMDKLADAARSAQNAASRAGNWVKVTLSSQKAKDSLSIAGYTASMGGSVYGLVVGVPAALALGTTGGFVLAIGGVVIFTASTVASSIGLAHSLAQNRGQPGAGSLGTAATRTSQGLSLIGGPLGGTKADWVIGIFNATTPEIENLIRSNTLTPEQLEALLNRPEVRNALNNSGVLVSLHVPEDKGQEGGEGGNGGSGGGCGPCP